MRKIEILFIMFFLHFSVFAQNDNSFVRKGNKNYESNNYIEAEKLYRKAIEKNKKSVNGTYNLGNSLYKQNRFLEAAKLYDTLIDNVSIDDDLKAKLYHNVGNSFLNEAINNKTLQGNQKQEYAQKSIDAYKKSLRLNPKDLDTKYNLSYAQKLIQKLQNEQNNKNNKDNKDDKQNQENKDKQNKDDKQDDKKDNNKNEDNKNQNNKEEKEQQPQKAESKISKEDAERMLNAVQNKEKQTLENIDKTDKAVKVKIQKDW